MNLYPLVKPCLFAMDPERAHNLTLNTLDKVHALGLGFLSQEKIAPDERTFCGLKIPNPVGLAAGLADDLFAGKPEGNPDIELSAQAFLPDVRLVIGGQALGHR